jgi:hypothetical protein
MNTSASVTGLLQQNAAIPAVSQCDWAAMLSSDLDERLWVMTTLVFARMDYRVSFSPLTLESWFPFLRGIAEPVIENFLASQCALTAQR